MEHTAKRSHEVTLIGDIQDREQIHIYHRGGNSRGKVRLTLTDLSDFSVTSPQLQ